MRYLLIAASLLLVGCATFNHKLVYWPDHDSIRTVDGQVINIVGNPHITCYNKTGALLADGIFVRVNDDHCTGDCTYIIVDEFGKDYVQVRNDQHNYCVLWSK